MPEGCLLSMPMLSNTTMPVMCGNTYDTNKKNLLQPLDGSQEHFRDRPDALPQTLLLGALSPSPCRTAGICFPSCSASTMMPAVRSLKKTWLEYPRLKSVMISGPQGLSGRRSCRVYRVGGGLTAPASHTTVRAVRHTAVHARFIKR